MDRIFNLFIFTDGKLVLEIGASVHEYLENDQKSEEFLKNRVYTDFETCEKYQLPSFLHDLNKDGTLNYTRYFSRVRLGRGFEVFEEIFNDYSATAEPLACVTIVVNGKPEIDISTDHAPFMYGDHQDHPKVGPGVMSDYLQKYMTEDGFDMPTLIHNDYFGAIKLTFNNKYYVSCVKLLVSFIDTIAYLEYGDEKNIFAKWLNTFCSLSEVNVSSEELWEHRNSVLHMTSLDSRKVASGKVARISFCVAGDGYVTPEQNGIKFYNLKSLIDCIASGLSNWIQSYNEKPENFTAFIERYDKVISDDRHALSERVP